MPQTQRRTRPRLDPSKVMDRRLELGLSQTDLAARAGLSRQYVCDIEAGRRNGLPLVHMKIAKALRLRRIADLYRDEAAA